ncbi:diguanylate cyclase domain-containing protein [Balneatrix alpica]|uniref:diguanylate cyclase n=1 Tax=Balneatrix alpica TaxID=75684 RepID=A0ABV5Z9D0_9GAMM|nr:diguanylate cyclase [Balneatrix alpica]
MSLSWFGIREKLLVAFLGVVLIILLVASGLFYQKAYQLLETSIKEQLSMLHQNMSERLGARLEAAETVVGQIASRTQLRQLLATQDRQSEATLQRLRVILADAKQASSWIQGVALYDVNGQWVTGDRQSLFKPALTLEADSRRGQWLWSQQLDDYMLYFRPLYQQEQLIGYVGSAFDTDLITDSLRGIASRGGVEVIIVQEGDPNQTQFLASSNDLISETPSLKFNPFQLKTAGQLMVVDGNDYREVPVLGMVGRLAHYPLGLIVKADKAVTFQPLTELTQTLALLFLGALCLALLITFLLSTTLTKPIVDMTQVATLIASGDMERRIAMSSRDELGTLAAAMNRMADNLVTAQRQLQRRVNVQEQQMQEMGQKLLHANEELLRLSRRDGLTQLHNRISFDTQLAQEWNRAKREQTPVALIMMDVDYFKRYNDALGHPAGDEVLKHIATLLSCQAQRSGEVAARVGGEEFALLLPGVDLARARVTAERVRAQLAELGLPHPDSPANSHVTLSIGISARVPDMESTSDTLLKEADNALYEAKAQGRNRIFALLE